MPLPPVHVKAVAVGSDNAGGVLAACCNTCRPSPSSLIDRRLSHYPIIPHITENLICWRTLSAG